MARPTKAQIEAAALELAEADEARGLVSLHVPPEARTKSEMLADIEADAEQDLGELLRAAFGNDPGAHAKIQIYKRDARTKVRAYCGDYTPDQFREGGVALVKQDFGAGDFEYRAYGGAGLITRGYFSIADIKPNPAAAGAAVQSDFARALETIAAGQAAILQAMTQPRESPQAGMMQALEMMRAVKELLPAPAPVAPAASLVDQLTALRTLKEFMREEAPETPDPDNPMSMVAPLLDLVKTSMQGGKAPANAPAESDALPAITAPASIQNAQPSPDDEMKFILDHVVSQAKAKADPRTVGLYLFQVLPDEAVPLLRADTWRAALLALAPSLAFHATWLDAVRADCLARFDADAAKG